MYGGNQYDYVRSVWVHLKYQVHDTIRWLFLSLKFKQTIDGRISNCVIANQRCIERVGETILLQTNQSNIQHTVWPAEGGRYKPLMIVGVLIVMLAGDALRK